MSRAFMYLSHSPNMRYANGAVAYFAQGIPAGFMHIALPAWLAFSGVPAVEIATYLAIITLPWAFKLLVGPVMEHFEFLPMGKRRPWVLGAQLGMVISLLALTVIDDPIGQFGTLTAICFMVNVFTATQDVAVDGMSIDLVPLEEEGRLNAFMSFGKAFGWAVTAAVTGSLLVSYGIPVTGQVCAGGAFILFIFLAFVRERKGERLLPWSAGEASSRNARPPSFRRVFSDLNHIVWTRASFIIMTIMFFDGLLAGYGAALMPIAAVNVFNFSSERWADLNAVMGLAGALLALGLGPVIDMFGAKRFMGLTILLMAVHAFLLAGLQGLWANNSYVLFMMSAWILLLPVIMVCALALAMSICSHVESATQFAIYMSIGNLGASGGSMIYGAVAGHTSWGQDYALRGLLAFMLFLAILLYRRQHQTGKLLEEEPQAVESTSSG